CIVLKAHVHPGRTRCERRNEDGREHGDHDETNETIHEIGSPSASVESQTTGQNTEAL
ncbi:MAG: hypothetical protein QOF50_76, partial [Gaiellaceae bacterium]|nr:hypothetical protein [Gaiellaceae bacterium]